MASKSNVEERVCGRRDVEEEGSRKGEVLRKGAS